MTAANDSRSRGETDDTGRDTTANDGPPVVGIGASAGGLAALSGFFDALPDDTGMAFVVIVHLDPNHESRMAELLQSHTSMPVAQATGSARVQPGHVYIIPPDKELSLADGHLRLSARKGPKAEPRPRPIDLFFRTLAEVRESDAVGIVLSGTGTDGTQGIRWIKERGGVAMAQAPDDAEHDSMPRGAIATGQVDVVAPVAELASELVRLRRAGARLPDAGETLGEGDSAALARILAHVRVKTGHDFTGYKRATVLRRLERRMQFSDTDGLTAYLHRLHRNPDEVDTLHRDLLITVTGFFRDPKAFLTLEKEVIPELFADKGPGDEVRVWAGGCATGEEAYSLAILLCEHADRLAEPPHMRIFASDVHKRALACARAGVYAKSVVAEVSPERLERFFVREGDGYRIRKTLREKVLFAPHDLLTDPPFSKLDLISCRNLMIYLRRDAQRRLLEIFHYALRPGGHLFMGSSESHDAAPERFAVVDKVQRIFRSKSGAPAIAPRFTAAIALEGDGDGRPRSTAAKRERSETFSFSGLHRQLLEAYAPPSLVVNAEGEVVHLSDGVGRYLRVGGGEPTRRLLDMVGHDLQLELRTLLHAALARGEPAEGHWVAVDGAKRDVRMTVRPVRGKPPAGTHALIVFDERPEAVPTGSPGAPERVDGPEPASDANVLARELEETRARLRAMAEEHETTIEELQASNEELQSINEEQKATSEELETSREELQSINEELRTLNQEHRVKNEELTWVNSDLDNLIDSTEIATLFLDRGLHIRRYTPAVTKIFNFVASDRGRPISDVTHRLDYDELREDALRVLRTLAPVEREVPGEDGRWFVVRLAPYRSMDDRIDGVVATFVDTTARKTGEVEREGLLSDARVASGAKSDFIGVMSHEFRTPLNAINGYAELLEIGTEGPLTEGQRKQLDRIKVGVRHLTHMIEEVLSFSRMEAGSVTLHRAPADFAVLLREAAASLEPEAARKGLALHVEVPDGPLTVVTDAGKLRQILYNLLGNAVRYTDEGEVRLRGWADGESMVIEVEDTGVGISSEDRERIFERFWQVDQSRTRSRGGTGLGLTVSRDLARLLGGDTEVESEPGRGSTFRVRLPVEGAVPAAAEREEEL